MGRKSREKKERRDSGKLPERERSPKVPGHAELVSFRKVTDDDIDELFGGGAQEGSEPITRALMDELVQAGSITRKMADEALEEAKHGARYNRKRGSLVYLLETDLDL